MEPPPHVVKIGRRQPELPQPHVVADDRAGDPRDNERAHPALVEQMLIERNACCVPDVVVGPFARPGRVAVDAPKHVVVALAMGTLEQVEQLPEEDVHREDVALVFEAVSKLGKRGERADTPVLTRIRHRGIIGGVRSGMEAGSTDANFL